MPQEQIKHIELIQAVITRMANNSFMLKGWTITLISGIFLLSSVKEGSFLFILPFLPTLAFWGLDSYYLWQERLFRKLYDAARKSYTTSTGDFELFTMDTRLYEKDVDSWFDLVKSKTESPFYGSIVLINIFLCVYSLLFVK